jgi:hypothetical protein
MLFSSVFFIGLGYFISKLFKGLHPLKMLVGFAFLLPIIGSLLELNSTLYTTLFVAGVLFRFGNPFGRVFSFYEDFQVHRLYKKSLNSQRDSIQQDIDEKVKNASSHFKQKEDDLRRQEENLRREQREFQRKKSNQSDSQKPEEQPDRRTPMQILGLSPGYSKDDLKKAYKRESLKYHPDKVRHKPKHIQEMSAVEFKKIVSAYNELER